jgi:hypothetical protein
MIESINNGRQVNKTFGHRDIDDIHRSCLIEPLKNATLQHLREYLMSGAGVDGTWSAK